MGTSTVLHTHIYIYIYIYIHIAGIHIYERCDFVRACVNDVRKIKIGKSKIKNKRLISKKHCEPC